MTQTTTQPRSVIVERDIPFPAEKLWRALTQPHLMGEWLMRNNFQPQLGHHFQLHGDWGGTIDCEVREIEAPTLLSYTWNFVHDDAAFNLRSVVTFTLTPTPGGTHLRVEQSGFAATQKQALGGANAGWTNMLGKLEAVLASLDEGDAA